VDLFLEQFLTCYFLHIAAGKEKPMNEKSLKPAIHTLFFLMFFDIILIVQGNSCINDYFTYFISLGFLGLVLSYFTDFLHPNNVMQEKIYNIFVCIGFPTLSSYVVFFENFQTESIFLFFIQLNFFTFYVKYKLYLRSVVLGVFLGYIFFYVSNDFVFYRFNLKKINQYCLFMFSFLTSVFLWKTTYSQFLRSLYARESEIEDNITMMVHELNSPLTAIKLFSQNLKDNNKNNDLISQFTDNIFKYVDRALFQVNFRKNNLRKYMSNSKLEQVDMKNFLSECITNYLKTKSFNIKIEITGSNFFINSDINFLYSIFINLTENACYFIKKAGKGEIIIQLNESENNYFIKFKDTGTGIKPDVLPLIFQKGYSRRNEGTGMGLFMSQQLVYELNGKITCYSTYKEYTEFLIEFPKTKMKSTYQQEDNHTTI